jgi:hypothetical protein
LEGISMNKTRALRAQSPALILSVLALVFSLGGGAYAATALGGQAPGAHAAKTVRLRFHRLALIHGWKTAPKALNTGTPSYTVSNGIVYLSGGIFQPVQGKAEFAVLPKGARPATNLFITVSVEQGVSNVGTLFISPKGVMEVYATPTGEGTPASDLTTLGGVSFPLGS